MNPEITVVIPTFNRCGQLAQLLKALGNAIEGGRVELIVVDDGSTDGTTALLARQRGVVVIRQDNRGPAAARNAGVRRANAPIVAFTDDDCLPGPEWPMGLLPIFDDPEVGGVGGDIVPQVCTSMSVFIDVERQVRHGRVLGRTVDYLVTANAAYRAVILADLGGFDEGFAAAAGEDVDLAWRVRAAGWRLLVVDQPLVRHDHRVAVRAIMATYHKHGRARATLRKRHTSAGLSSAGARAASPMLMIQRWRDYRSAGASRSASAGFLVLRSVGLACYLGGLVQGFYRIARAT